MIEAPAVAPSGAAPESSASGTVWADPADADLVPKFELNKENWDENRCSGVLLANEDGDLDAYSSCTLTATGVSKSLAPGVLEALSDPQQWPDECASELESFTSKLRALETMDEMLPDEATMYDVALTILVNEINEGSCLI